MGGQPIEIDYLGPLAQAQKRLFKIQGIRAGVEMTREISEIYPYASDMIDGDKMMVEALDSVGFPAKALRTPEEIQQIREIRQKQEEEMRMLEQAEQLSKATQKLSKPMEEDSPMKLLTEGEAGEAEAA
jgi:hypothetical protein